MNNKIISFKRGKTETSQIYKWHKEGYKVICPLCKSEIVFKTSGSWCPKNLNHYSVHNYPSNIARELNRRADERQKIRDKDRGQTQKEADEHYL